MTNTARWIGTWNSTFVRRSVLAGTALTIGLVLGAFGVGLLLARAGVYGSVPPAVLLGWIAAVGGVLLGAGWLRIALRRVNPVALAR